MSDTAVPPAEATPPAGGPPPADNGTPPAQQTPPAGTPDADPPGAEHLGDPGKKALDEMKAKWKAAEAVAKENSEKLAALQAQVDGKEAEHQAQLAAQRVKDEALAAANKRILQAEVRAAAAGKLADPADALLHLDLSPFEVGDDGSVNSADIVSALDNLIKTKPYLAAQGGARFQGSADGGARNDTPPATLPEQIAAAEKAGDWATARSLKSRQLVELNTPK